MSLDVQQISLDISKQPTPQQVRLGQGDANATTLIVSVFDDGVPYSLDSYSVRLEMRLPDSDTYYSTNGTRSGNVATFEIDETYAATSFGFNGFGYVDILSGDTVICSTSRFQLVVLENAQEGADPSTAYSNGIIEATERAIAAAEAAEGVILQDVPLMSPPIRGGAQLGEGLSISDGVLSVDSSTVPLPTMSASVKGAAKLGSGLSVTDDVLSLSDEPFTASEKSKLAGIEANANNYSLPTMASNTKGGAKLGSGLSVTDDVLSVDASTIATGQLPIANGGTGASTAAAARTALDFPVELTTTASDIATAATGFTINSAAYTSYGKVATIRISVKTANGIGSGDITNTTIATLKSGKRPNQNTPISTMSVGPVVVGYINGNGGIVITATHSAIAADSSLEVGGTFILA